MSEKEKVSFKSQNVLGKNFERKNFTQTSKKVNLKSKSVHLTDNNVR